LIASDRLELVSNHECKSNPNPNPDPNQPDPNRNPEHNPNPNQTITKLEHSDSGKKQLHSIRFTLTNRFFDLIRFDNLIKRTLVH